MAQSTPLTLTLNEAEETYQPQFSFKFDAPAHRFMLLGDHQPDDLFGRL
ncbi:Uncharacterised protein [Serratia fonticola]|uniref:Uncharacterized protein n=1 Tax=Serratia fonticola TaxID=47917 RepID=A0A4V6KRB9_SERFO|nr:Uncharacterised protein [Serratia fonticola]